MVLTNHKTFSKEIVVDTAEILELLKTLDHREKERIYFMMKGVELVHNSESQMVSG